MTEDEMVGWHHQLNGREFEQTLGDDEGQGTLVCCRPWGHKASHTAEPLNSRPSLMAQRLRLCVPNAGDLGSIPAQGTRSHTAQLKILHAATKTRHGQNFKNICFKKPK